jgi:phytanoyl-CoA hydroxylase
MLTSEQVEFFHENGYLQGPRILSDDQLVELRAALDRVLRGESEGKPEYIVGLGQKDDSDTKAVNQTVNAWCADPVFRRHIHNPAITTAVAQLLGTDEVRLWHDQVLIKPPGGGKVVPWHQDWMYWQMVDRPDMLTCWIPLTDATEQNGCMMFVPRSHKWGLFEFIDLGGDMSKLLEVAQVPEGEKIEVVACPTKAGYCTFHHSLTFHGTSINQTDKARSAVIAHYMSGDCRYTAKTEHPMKKHTTVAIGERLTGEMYPLVYANGSPVPAA